MTSDQAREIAIRVLRGERFGYTDPNYLVEAAAVLEAQANVEEKKAAFLEAARAWAAWDQEEFRTFKGPMWEWNAEHERKLKTFNDAYRALVEASRESAT